LKPLRSDTAAHNRAHYDDVTHGWSLIMGRHLHFGLFDEEGTSLERATEAMVKEAFAVDRLRADDVVFDIGCGTGGAARLVWEESGCRLVCVTNSETGAALTRHTLAAGGCATHQVVVADAQQYTYPPGAATLVCFLESSHLMPDKRLAFARAQRALVPSGRLVIADLVDRTDFGRLELPARELVVLRSIFGDMSPMKPDDYRCVLTELGFRDIEVEDVSERAAPTLRWWRERAETQRAALLQRWPPGRIARFQQACDVVIRAFARRQAGYAIVRATAPTLG
jgi:cyclopropane fatty-acyl-phospholipid synthase-like methyltransferase